MRRLRTVLEAFTALALPASWFIGLLALACIHRADITEPTVIIQRKAPVARFVNILPEGVKNGSHTATEVRPDEHARPLPAQAAESQARESQAAITESTPVTRKERATTQHAAVASARASAGEGAVSDRTRSGRRGTKGSRKGKACESNDPRVSQLDAFEYALDMGVLDYYSSHLVEADQLAYTTWHKGSDGRVDGFRVRGMGCGNLLRQSGLKNGDVIHRINDQEIRTLKGAMRAYKRLRDSRMLRLTITRKDGSRVKLKYKLR